MASVIWSDRAQRDVQRLYRFIAEKNPKAASDAAQTIFDGAGSLVDHPQIGRPALDLPPEFREWPVRFGGGYYLIFYRYAEGIVSILAVRHGREARY